MIYTVFSDEIIKEQNNQLFIQLLPKQEESISQFCQRLANILEGKGFQIIKMTCFGSLNNRIQFEEELACRIENLFPITWIEGQNCSDSFMNGIQLWATKLKVDYLKTDFGARASFFENSEGNYLFIGDVLSESALSPDFEYDTLLRKLDNFLKYQGFEFKDIVRTWYFLKDILMWYDDFNRVRSNFFKQTGVFDTLIPASTGVSGNNKTDTSVTMELLAFKPNKGNIDIKQVKSPLQNEANDYGSSFSRAIKINAAGDSWMSISGTASILPSGKTANIGDTEKQIQHTFEVIERIGKQEGFTFDDVVRATAYLKDKSTVSILLSFLRTNTRYKIPLIITENTICRDNLLFELEMDLIKTK